MERLHKPAQMVAEYLRLSDTVGSSADESNQDSNAATADTLLEQLGTQSPQDAEDIAALTQLVEHLIVTERAPQDALPILRVIGTWATTCFEDGRQTGKVSGHSQAKRLRPDDQLKSG